MKDVFYFVAAKRRKLEQPLWSDASKDDKSHKEQSNCSGYESMDQSLTSEPIIYEIVQHCSGLDRLDHGSSSVTKFEPSMGSMVAKEWKIIGNDEDSVVLPKQWFSKANSGLSIFEPKFDPNFVEPSSGSTHNGLSLKLTLQDGKSCKKFEESKYVKFCLFCHVRKYH